MNEQKDADLIRTFICIELPRSILERIAALQNELRRIDGQVSWVKPSNIHLTLKFLGDVPRAKTLAVVEAVRRATSSCSPFQVEVWGTGCFPSRRRPNVLWVGLKETPEALTRLHRALENELAGEGFGREAKAFMPHLTIGRVRNPRHADQLVRTLIERGFAGENFPVNEVLVMQSRLSPQGAIYTPQAVLRLAP